MPMERSRSDRGRDMSRSHTHVGKYPAQNERSRIHGIFEREQQLDDISEMGEHEVCISESRILVQGILCGHSREKHKCNKRIHSESVEARQRERATEHV